jgi:hypothetical protein
MKHLSIRLAFLFSVLSISGFAQIFQDMGKYNTQGIPTYLDQTKESISPNLLSDLNILLPDGESLPKKNPSLYNGNTMTAITLKQAGDVYLSFVSEGADFKSAVGFYTFKGTPPNQAFMINNLKVVFPNVSGVNSGGGLQQGHRVKLGNFPTGTSIGFFLISNGFQNGRVMQAGNEVFYTDPKYNPEFNKELKKHVVLLYDEASSRYVLMFEDFNRTGGDQDFNDAVFLVSSNSAGVLSTDGATHVQKEKETKLGVVDKKIIICHYRDGNRNESETVTISESDWPVHLAHGDQKGECSKVVEIKVPVQKIEEVKRITICHYPPGNPNSPQEITIPESAWAVHEAHGDVQGSCDSRPSPGNKLEVNRITVCHYPPGNPNNPQEISIPESAWSVHEAHGDTRGGCGGSNPIKEVKVEEKRMDICHFPPNDPNNPKEISIPVSAWSVHEAHGDFPGKCNGGGRIIEKPTEELRFTICHYPPGQPNNPQEIVIPESAWTAHEAHGDTQGKCGGNIPIVETPVEERKITICHYPPGKPNNPQEIVITESAWTAHEAHGDTQGKCGGNIPVVEAPTEEKKITICHYPPGKPNNPQEIVVSESAWSAHEAHGDTQGKCGGNTPVVETPVKENKITICHIPPGNPGNPQEISIPESAWAAHAAHGDTQGKCGITPSTEIKADEKKITICHYPPGKKINPQEITIPESAWKAHEAHGDKKGKCSGN